MKIVKEFSRFAHEYNKYNVIQKEVAKKLCDALEEQKYKTILDVGAGDGAIYHNLIERNYPFNSFTAMDLSSEMLMLHPSGESIQKVCLDFNETSFLEHLPYQRFDLVLSSSALQWSENLQFTLKSLSSLSNEFYFAFFTSNTFKTLHQTANIKSPIYSQEEILDTLGSTYSFQYEIVEYSLEFGSVHEMLRYIKKSGVSSGKKQLGYKEVKRLIEKYLLNYLEFEVLFVKATLK